jgi:hypothetical protein
MLKSHHIEAFTKIPSPGKHFNNTNRKNLHSDGDICHVVTMDITIALPGLLLHLISANLFALHVDERLQHLRYGHNSYIESWNQLPNICPQLTARNLELRLTWTLSSTQSLGLLFTHVCTSSDFSH